MNQELKPCPFCGSAAMPCVQWAQCSNSLCPAFHIQTCNFKAWNTRAAPSEDVRAEVDEQDLFESVFPMPCHTMRFDGGYAATEFNAWSAHDFVKKWDGWKARARLNPQ
ncbi:hypothetical protein [Pseudomonas sp. SLFW]|uniref:hypothetical protein n=1 Tax=Pseudomonas sp. SLFW TaxID=2683259 RepID=UPI001411CC00|nr:hypothetical protein [Pseudomonas sp. SLFW]NBB11773.1 hypothetical protein [Pseudomonas sp. SLFW]